MGRERLPPLDGERLVVPVLLGAEDVHVGVHPRLRHPPASSAATASASSATASASASASPAIYGEGAIQLPEKIGRRDSYYIIFYYLLFFFILLFLRNLEFFILFTFTMLDLYYNKYLFIFTLVFDYS